MSLQFEVPQAMLSLLIFVCLGGINVVCYVPEQVFESLSKGSTSDKMSCFLKASKVILTRQSEKEGFHRSIITSVTAILQSSCDQCGFMMVESLPEGMYVDPYQVKSMQDFEAPTVLTLDKIDVEKPEHLSPNHTIVIYTPPIKPSNSDHMTDHLTSTIDLPVHLRYHAPSLDPEVSHAEIYLPIPELFLHCTECEPGSCSNDTGLIRAPCTAENQSICSWTSLDYDMETYEELEFRIPVGQEWHSVAVTAVTLLAITMGMIVLLVAMSKDKKNKVMKQR